LRLSEPQRVWFTTCKESPTDDRALQYVLRGRIIGRVMIPALFDPADAPEPGRVYLNYRETCRRSASSRCRASARWAWSRRGPKC